MSDSPQSPGSGIAHEEAREGRSMVFWAGLSLLMCALALALAFGGPWLHRRYHSWCGRRLAEKATALLQEQRWEAASQLLHDGFKTYGHEPAVLRALGRLFIDGYDDPATASGLLRQVLVSGQGTPEDIRRLSEAMVKMGDIAEARKLYDGLPPADQSAGPGMELLANILRQSGRPGEADELMRKALALHPDDPRSQLRLALLDEAASFEVSQSVAAQTEWTIARRGDAVAVEAIDHLSLLSSLTALQSQELLTLVDANPKAMPHDHFVVLSAWLRLHPLEREAAIAAEVKKNEGRPPTALFDFLRWLGAEKQYEQIVALVPAAAALRDPDVFVVYVDALAAAERWSELMRLMNGRKLPASDATRWFIAAECNAHLHPDLIETRANLEKVYTMAGPAELQIVRRAAGLAEAQGLTDLALTGYRRIAEARPGLKVTMLEKVLELQGRDKNIPGMLATLRQLHSLRPASRAYIDQANYLRLLAGEELEIACQAVLGFDQPATAQPDSPAFPQSLLRALAALRLGDSSRMTEEIRSAPTPKNLPAGQRAVVAGLRALAGDEAGAFRLAESIPPALLLKEEHRFLSLAVR